MKLKTFALLLTGLLLGTVILPACKKTKEEPKIVTPTPEPEPEPEGPMLKLEGKVAHFSSKDIIKYIWDYKTHPKELVYKGDRLAVIDFNATWCSPCKALYPHLELRAKEHQDEVYFIGVDIDTDREVWVAASNLLNPINKYFGSGIPAMVLISRDGKTIKTLVGFTRKVLDQLDSFIQEHK